MKRRKTDSGETDLVLEESFGKNYFRTGAYGDYKKVAGEWVPYVAKKISKIVGKSHAKILDVGCAHGYLIAQLQKKYGHDVRGVDFSRFAVKNAEKSVRKRVKRGDILKLPFKENSRDTVVCLDVINYLGGKDVEKAVDSLVRVAKGYIFFGAIFKHSWTASQKHNPDKLRKSVFSEKEYIDFFRKAGAKIIEGFDGRNGGKILIFRKTGK